jgi:hypothetical protein
VTISVACRRNGKRLCCAQYATTFTNLTLPTRVFVSAQTTVAASMGNVKIAACLLFALRSPLREARSDTTQLCSSGDIMVRIGRGQEACAGTTLIGCFADPKSADAMIFIAENRRAG